MTTAMHLAPGHSPFDTRVFHKECRTLVAAGYDVKLVAPHDRAEIVDGVEIIPLPTPRTRFHRFFGNALRALRIAWRARTDVYHLHDIEMLPVGALLALAGRRVIFDSHEDYPRLVRDRPWLPAVLRPALPALVGWAERLLVLPMQAIISAEDEGARRFRTERTAVVRNYVLDAELEPRSGSPEASTPRAVYIGAISRQRGVVRMIDGVWSCRDLGARLTLIGPIDKPGLEDDLRRCPSWRCVDYLGARDRASVVSELARSDVGLVLWQPTRKHVEGAVPVKLLEYLAAGLPVVASDFSAIRAIVAGTDCAILVDPTDPEAVEAALRTLLEDTERARGMGAQGRELVLRRYRWSSQAPALLAVYAKVVPRPVADSRALVGDS